MRRKRIPVGHRPEGDKAPLASGPQSRAFEQELDALIETYAEQQSHDPGSSSDPNSDPIERLRRLMLNTLVPAFVDLVEKYSPSGLSMQMDASNFLEGGREIQFEFGIGKYRTRMAGTVTTEAIAFHETRYTPDVHGELVSGPMLRLRNLNEASFRNFICERMTTLIRSAMRRP